jgi:adenylate cyclase
VDAISDGQFSHRLSISSNDEFGSLSTTFNRMAQGLQEKVRMSRYVSQFVIDEVKKEDSEPNLLGEERKCTILFTDIRGFTTMSEQYPPQEIVELLNSYLEIMTKVIQSHGGVIDKFIGDAIMAVFYPLQIADSESDELRAVKAALLMRQELAKFNEMRQSVGKFPIDNGIGINTGKVILGNIGSKDYRIDLTVIGDNVNLAARLESVSKEGRYTNIMVSERTLPGLGDCVELEKLKERTVKGKSETVGIYEVIRLISAG